MTTPAAPALDAALDRLIDAAMDRARFGTPTALKTLNAARAAVVACAAPERTAALEAVVAAARALVYAETYTSMAYEESLSALKAMLAALDRQDAADAGAGGI